jgi:hypothetical protein
VRFTTAAIKNARESLWFVLEMRDSTDLPRLEKQLQHKIGQIREPVGVKLCSEQGVSAADNLDLQKQHRSQVDSRLVTAGLLLLRRCGQNCAGEELSQHFSIAVRIS